MSVSESRDYTPAEAVAGFLAAIALVISVIGIVEKPVRTIPLAILVATIAAAMGGRHRGLAAFAVGAAAVCFVLGMIVAAATGESPRDLY